MRFGSVFSGIEAASVAWEPLGWQCKFVAEIEPFPAAVLAERYPHVPNVGDVTAMCVADLPHIDVLVGGSPCFPAGVRITTSRGLVAIEDVGVGDLVLTHTMAWQRVMKTGSRVAETIVVKGQGHPGLVTTHEHPFYSRLKRAKSIRRGGKAVRLVCVDEPEWVAAKDMGGRHWASVVDFPDSTIPTELPVGNERPMPEITADLMWLAGAYLGDGWTRSNDRRGAVVFGVNESKADAIMERIDRLALVATITEERTTTRVVLPRRCFARWLRTHFGSGASGKRIPSWALGMPHDMRRSLLDGYIAMDGTPSESCRGWRCSSVSWDLVLGVKMLANSLGHASSVGLIKNSRTQCVIEGRVVSEQPYWTVTISNSDRSSFEMNGMRFGLVRSVHPTGRRETVFNLEVENDNSFIADGIVVHNCQAFSIAGKRLSLGDTRGNLTLTFTVLAHELQDKHGKITVVWENVPGVLNTEDNAFGCFLGALVGGRDALPCPRGFERWPDHGMVAGPRGRAVWRVLDAQWFGLAQRRERVFLVASLGDNGLDPAAVLFEPQGMQGDRPACVAERARASARSARAARPKSIWAALAQAFRSGASTGNAQRTSAKGDVSPTLPARTTAGGGLGTDFECDGGLVSVERSRRSEP